MRARDTVGNVSRWTQQRCTTRPLDDRSSTAAVGWQRVVRSGFYARTVTTTKLRGSTLRIARLGGRRVALVVTRCRTCGVVQVTFAGRAVAKRSLHAGRTVRRSILLLPAFPRRTGTLTITVVSGTGHVVQVDGLALLP